jgi:hypothetical protein
VPVHWLCGVLYGEKGRKSVTFSVLGYRAEEEDLPFSRTHRPVSELALPAPPEGDLPWRRLSLEVTPEEVRASWRTQALGATSYADLTRLANRFSNPFHQNFPAGFSPRGALGLYVMGGQASFRNLVVEPLP